MKRRPLSNYSFMCARVITKGLNIMFVCRPEGSGGQAGEDRRHGAAGGHLRGQEEGHAGGTRPMEESHGREVSFPYKNSMRLGLSCHYEVRTSLDVMGSGQELTFRRSCFNLNTVFNK